MIQESSFKNNFDVVLAWEETTKKETLEIAALIEAGSAALTSQDTWVEVPK